MTVMFRSLLAVEIQARVEGGVPRGRHSDAVAELPDGHKTRPRTRLVIAPRPAQEGTSLLPKHTKVPIELRRRRHRMGATRCLFLVDSVEKIGLSTRPIFSAPWMRFSNADAGGLRDSPQTQRSEF